MRSFWNLLHLIYFVIQYGEKNIIYFANILQVYSTGEPKRILRTEIPPNTHCGEKFCGGPRTSRSLVALSLSNADVDLRGVVVFHFNNSTRFSRKNTEMPLWVLNDWITPQMSISCFSLSQICRWAPRM